MRKDFMIKGFLAIILASAVMLSSSGCVYVIIGAAGAVGGYVVSPDTVAGTTTHSLGETWDAAHEIAGIMGSIVQANEQTGVLVATINSAQVTITMVAVNASTTKLSVKARKSFMPKVDLAQDVYTKIVNNMGK